jgi:hypothetical protein
LAEHRDVVQSEVAGATSSTWLDPHHCTPHHDISGPCRAESGLQAQLACTDMTMTRNYRAGCVEVSRAAHAEVDEGHSHSDECPRDKMDTGYKPLMSQYS